MKTFDTEEKSKYWSIKNRDILPKDISHLSIEKYWFTCNVCNHDFQSTPNRIVKRNSWCSYCSNHRLCEEDCKICFDKSFASHEKAFCWSIKNELSARQVFKSSGLKYLLNCDKCNHEFESALNHIISMNSWCPYCPSSPKLLCKNDCKVCYDKSFASSDKSIYWSNKNILKPRDVFKNCNKKFIFLCCNNHEFESTLNNITNLNRWCISCINKTETILFEWLNSLYNVKKQAKFDWCKNIKPLPFDFLLEEFKLIIELDGRQHFEQVRKWTSHIVTQKRDKIKMESAIKNGYSIIRLKQEDVWNNKINWKSILQEKIKLYNISNIIYIGDYTNYQECVL
jgi:very-short-patch-repair endonuclease